MTFADLLRRCREESGTQVGFLAGAIGVSRNTLHNWESGATEPTVTQLLALARVLDCHPCDLLPLPNPRRPDCRD